MGSAPLTLLPLSCITSPSAFILSTLTPLITAALSLTSVCLVLVVSAPDAALRLSKLDLATFVFAHIGPRTIRNAYSKGHTSALHMLHIIGAIAYPCSTYMVLCVHATFSLLDD
ncbi:hypothetical protein BGW80DRAFT_1331928, partial [Lactifluus volemus]